MRIERALTLIQPWATLIALGEKCIETRSWSTAFRGWMAITASKAFPRDCYELIGHPPFATALHPWLKEKGDLPRGAVVCVANLVACRSTQDYAWINNQERSFGDFSPGRYGWMFSEVKALKQPVPCRGMQGLWGVSADLEARILEQLAA